MINKEIYNLAGQAGATDESGGSIKNANIICFTRIEFEDFIQRFSNYLKEELENATKKNV